MSQSGEQTDRLAGIEATLDPTYVTSDSLNDIEWLVAQLREARAEIARHHVDFERWEQMAADGAGKGALLGEAVELLTVAFDWLRRGVVPPLDERFAWDEQARAFLARVGSNQDEKH